MDIISLLHDKLSWAEKYLSQPGMSERDDSKDLLDFMQLLLVLNAPLGDYDDLMDYLESKGIDISYYPSVNDFLRDDLN